MKQNLISTPKAVLLTARTMFHTEHDSITQLVYFDRNEKGAQNIDLPLRKSLRGSVTFHKDPSDPSGNTIAQQIYLYRKNAKKYSTSILDTRYSHVKVSQNRVTVTMSFPLCDDPQRLTARMQNFANIIVDESDEIAAMLNQEGATKVQEAWKTLAEQFNEEGE